jgi:hypothetical protein
MMDRPDELLSVLCRIVFTVDGVTMLYSSNVILGGHQWTCFRWILNFD